MSTTTTNLGLTLPAGTDPADIAVLNTNFTTIDTFAGQQTAKDTSQDARMTAIENDAADRDDRLTALETSDTAQNGRLTALETSDTSQNGRLTALEQTDTAHAGRLTAIETKNTTQDGRLTALETKDNAQDAAIAAKLNTADVDDALSSTSTNPVQNKVVQAAILPLQDFIFGVGTTLEQKDDLNNYNQAGKLNAPTGAIAQTIMNTPWTASGFTVFVIPFITTTAFLQILIPNTVTGKWYRRRYTNSAWSNWIEYDGTEVT